MRDKHISQEPNKTDWIKANKNWQNHRIQQKYIEPNTLFFSFSATETNSANTFPNIWELVQGGSNHALDAMLTIQIENRERENRNNEDG